MGDKMRVYELAQKLGLDNKVLLERLKNAGIEAKNHLSVLDAAALHAFEGGNAPTEAPEEKVVEEKIEEQRINPGIIRRRRKEVPKAEFPEEKPVAVKPEPAEAAEEAVAPAAETETVEKAEPETKQDLETPVPVE